MTHKQWFNNVLHLHPVHEEGADFVNLYNFTALHSHILFDSSYPPPPYQYCYVTLLKKGWPIVCCHAAKKGLMKPLKQHLMTGRGERRLHVH